ncbi:polyhydroxyalkanoate synthesis regulator [Candidatus Parcubacteria bacterium]|nr:MAG: polyhydroxyalkanoate synthesis regulator [Candidatus Parcubacteria bacterium]
MRTLIERGVLAGLGLLSMTHEKAHQIVDELVKKGEVRREEVESFIEDLVRRGEEERQAMRKLVREEVSGVVGELGLATKGDIQALKEEIRKLGRS